MNFNFLKTSKLTILAAMAFLTATTVACKKDESNDPIIPSGKVALLQAAFESDSVNLFIATNKATNKLLGYGETLNYVDVKSGDQEFELKGKTNQSVVKKSFKVEKDKNYTLLAVNTADGNTFELVQLTEELTVPSGEKAKVRFVHASPDVNKLNLQVGDTKLAQNLEFKSASPFTEVDAKKTTFNIVDQATNEVLTTLNDVELAKGKIYTIWVSGLKESDDNSKQLKARLFTNK